MKMVKSLLLGSAAGLVAVAGAQAADLPVKAKAVEYVKVCSAYGAGFYYVPGTDTCLKIDGYARFDTYINAVGTFNPNVSSSSGTGFNGAGGGSSAVSGFPFATSDSSDLLTRARGVFGMDARTATDYGVLRSYVKFGMNWDSQTGAGSGSGVGFYFEKAFIQFAGFTFGYTTSFFDTGVNYALTQLYAGSYQWNTALAYTAQFGNGFSATLALEDAANRTTGIQASTAASSNSGISYTNYQSGNQVPDIVANLRVDQAWGMAMISGAMHQVAALTPTGAGVNYLGQSSTDSWGWALGGSLEFKLPMISPGDSLYIQANYADGALSYLGLSGTTQGRSTGLGSLSVGGQANWLSGAYYPIADAIWTGTGFDKETGWAVQAQYRHFWTPGLRSAVFGGYTSVSVPFNVLKAVDTNIWQVGANTIWSPVKNLDLGVEVLYSKVDGAVPLTTTGGSATTVPTSVVGGSADVWSGGFRAQRNF